MSENEIRLLLVPLEDLVVFPNMNVTLTVDVGDEDRVLLVPKHEDGYAKVEIAVARGKKSYDKRHALAEKQAKRETDRALRARSR